MFQEWELDWLIHRADGVVIDGRGKTHALSAAAGGLGSSDGGDTEGHALAEVMEKLERLQKYGTRLDTEQPAQAGAGEGDPCIRHHSCNPYAIAHKANHPPPGVPANVIAVAIDYDFATMNPALLQYIPTRHALLPNVLSSEGIVFVASRTIEAGEEMYLDYATSEHSRPEWYTDAARDPTVHLEKGQEKNEDTEQQKGSGFMGAPVVIDPNGDYALEVKIMWGTIAAGIYTLVTM